jgi:hypothetical protein
VLVPSAERAAIKRETPARISGELIVVARKGELKFCPMTVALCGSHKDNLSTHIYQFIYKETNDFQTFFDVSTHCLWLVWLQPI